MTRIRRGDKMSLAGTGIPLRNSASPKGIETPGCVLTTALFITNE
jgi:hypothetical protein